MDRRLSFIDEHQRKGMLFARVIRSKIPKGKIISITAPPLPDGYFTFSAEEIPGENRVCVNNEAMPLLNSQEVLYEGEPVMLLCGPSERVLNRLCRSVNVEYETDYTLLSFSRPSESQVGKRQNFLRGTPDEHFEDSTQIVEAEYHTGAVPESLKAPLGALAWQEGGKMEIIASSQWPFHVRTTVSEALGVKAAKVTVKTVNFSPGQDEKLVYPSIYAAYAALLCNKTGTPVRIVATLEEMDSYISVRPEVLVVRKSGLDTEGAITAEYVEIQVDVGAYPLFTKEILDQLCLGAAGAYSVSNIRVRAETIITSKPPMNVCKGFGLAQTLFSLETHYSRIAVLRHENPAAWKIKYLADEKLRLPTGEGLKRKPAAELMKNVVIESDFNRKHDSFEMLKTRRLASARPIKHMRGIGISVCYAGNGFTEKVEGREPYSVILRLDKKDKLSIHTSAVDPASEPVWKMIAGEVLGIPASSVEIIDGDTDTLPNSGPMVMSRGISVISDLIEKAAGGIKKQRFHKPLPLEVTRNYRGMKKQTWNSERFWGIPFHSLSWGAAVVEVELNPLILKPVIRGIWMAVDSGRIFNLKRARSAIEAEVFQALHRCSGNGTLNTDEKLPDIRINFMESGRESPGGLTQLPELLIPSAFLSALSQATGFYFDRLPITPDLIQYYMESS